MTKLYYITDCANLSTPMPIDGSLVEIEMELTTITDIAKLCRFTIDGTQRINEKEIDDTIATAPIDQISPLPWRINYCCCCLFIYKTDRDPPYLFPKSDLLLIFPKIET